MKPWSEPALEEALGQGSAPPSVDPDEERLWDFESRLWRSDPDLLNGPNGGYCEWLRQLMLRMRRNECNFDVRAPLLPRTRRAGADHAAANLTGEPREVRLKHLTRQAFRRPMPELGTLEYRALCKHADKREDTVYLCATTYMFHRRDWFVLQHRRLSGR